MAPPVRWASPVSRAGFASRGALFTRAGFAPRGTLAARAARAAVVMGSCLSLAGCSGGFFPAPIAMEPAPSESASAGPRAPFLALGPITWSREGKVAVRLRADGTLEDRGVVLGKLGADGVFTTRDRSRTLAMEPDGSVHVATGFDIVIDQEGTAITRVHGQPDESLTLAEAEKPRGGLPPLSVEGAGVPLRRTAMWILMIPDLLHIQSEDAQ